MKNTVIIIPTLNEEKNIPKIIKKILKVNKNFKILFIDDGSKDNSQMLIKSFKKKFKNISYIFRKNKSGIGSAHKEGLKICYKKKYKFVITMDADGTHDPNRIPAMFKLMKKENSHIINTSRFVLKNSLPGWPFSRKMMTYIRHFLIIFFLGLRYDASGAFRLYNTKLVKISNILLAKDNRYAFFWESLYILKKKNNKINEIPISLPYRIFGSSKMKSSDIISSFFYLISISIKKF
tara:strand:+ start:510 stop:1217 length:708 start_codon:yes stop_codon:yes gene_type:complete